MTIQQQSENYSLRQQLEALLHEARCNEEKMRRFDLLERRLIGAGSLIELLRLLLTEYKLAFGVEFITLTLVDHERQASRLLLGELDADVAESLSLIESPDMLIKLYGQEYQPRLSRFLSLRHRAIFGQAAQGIASVALLPLIRHDQLIGSLNLGSCNPERYTPDCGTAFLERLSAIISVCLESAFNQERLKLMGLTDGLTGVQNRRYFEHRSQVEISQARRYQHPLACMFLDIDKFKRINDTYGHQTGDEVLLAVANTIQSQLRAGDTIARYGGEEFVVLLPQTAGNFAREIAERIRTDIASRHFQSQAGGNISVTISIGLAMLPHQKKNEDGNLLAGELVAMADKALYQAKHSGRNRVVCDGSMGMGSALEGVATTNWRAWVTKSADFAIKPVHFCRARWLIFASALHLT